MNIKTQAIEEKICPLEFAVNAISGKWKVPIVWQINLGHKRPSEMLKGIKKVDRRVLNQQLKELELDGILYKVNYNELPPRVEYYLTPVGEQLIEVLWKLNAWGETMLNDNKD